MKNAESSLAIHDKMESGEAMDFNRFSIKLHENAQADFYTALEEAAEAFDSTKTLTSHEEKQYQMQSARELYFFARNSEIGQENLGSLQKEVAKILADESFNSLGSEIQSKIRVSEILLRAQAMPLGQRRQPLFAYLRSRQSDFLAANANESEKKDFFDEMHDFASGALKIGEPSEAIRAIEAIRSIDPEEGLYNLNWLSQDASFLSKGQKNEVLEHFKKILLGHEKAVEEKKAGQLEPKILEKALATLAFACSEQGDIQGVVRSLEKLKLANEKAFVLESQAVSNLLYHLKPNERAENQITIRKILLEVENSLGSLQGEGAVTDDQDNIEESAIRMNLAYSWAYLQDLEKTQETFRNAKLREKQAERIYRGNDYESKNIRKNLSAFNGVILGRVLVLMMEKGSPQAESILQNLDSSENEIDFQGTLIRTGELRSELAIAYMKYLKSSGSPAEKLEKAIDKYVFSATDVYFGNIRDLANEGVLQGEKLAKAIERFAKQVELDPERSGHEFLSALDLAVEKKVAVPRTLELARHLVDTPELMDPHHRVMFLSRLSELEREAK